jgi:hypothetical protein
MYNRKLMIGLGTPIAAVAVAGVAYATVLNGWTSSGAGTGSAHATTSTDSVIAGVLPVAANDLYPGASKSAFVTITNPNPYPVIVTSINAAYSRVVNTTCAATTVRTDAVPLNAAGITRSDAASAVIAAGDTGTYQLTVRMSNTADNACKNQSFVLGGDSTDGTGNFTATVISAATAQSF